MSASSEKKTEIDCHHYNEKTQGSMKKINSLVLTTIANTIIEI